MTYKTSPEPLFDVPGIKSRTPKKAQVGLRFSGCWGIALGYGGASPRATLRSKDRGVRRLDGRASIAALGCARSVPSRTTLRAEGKGGEKSPHPKARGARGNGTAGDIRL